MKKLNYLLVLLFTITLFAGCKKETPNDDPKAVDPTPTSAPATYTKKALLEFTTCAGCTFCPDGDAVGSELVAKYPDKFFMAALHNLQQGADKMATTDSKAFYTSYGNGNPSGLINRTTTKGDPNRANWRTNAAAELAKTAKCGLYINASKKTGSIYNVEIMTGVGTTDLDAGSYFMVAYVVEGEMSGAGSGWDQINYYNAVAGHKYYQKGNPVKGFIHENVFVSAVNTMAGTPIPADKIKAGGLNSFKFDVDVTSSTDVADLSIVAFIFNKKVSGSYIENVQRVKLGEIKKFD